MSDYRTPEEDRASAEQAQRIHAILDQAVHDGASLLVATQLGEPEGVITRWVNALWDGIRDGLPEGDQGHETLRLDDRLSAIMMLLEDRMFAESARILAGMRRGEPRA